MIQWNTDPAAMRELSDEQLLAAWRACDREADHPEQCAMADELERRGLDVCRRA